MANSAIAAPVDLSTWVAEGPGSWNVAGANDVVVQTGNNNPTVFHNNTNSQGTTLSGSITVTGSDDDFIGFVLGYDAGALNSTSADFWMIDWKKRNQTSGGTLGSIGLALSHVTGDLASGDIFADFWGHGGRVAEQVRATSLGSSGWVEDVSYTFDLTFTASLIELFVNGNLEISLAGSFEDGGFGFYNFSQAKVEYAGITADVIPSPVPLPASLPIMLVALGALGLAARRRKG